MDPSSLNATWAPARGNARGIIRRDDKPQTSYEEPRNQRAEFHALKRCLRDARRARARSVLRDPFKRISVLRSVQIL